MPDLPVFYLFISVWGRRNVAGFRAIAGGGCPDESNQ
jgi:hypothetical protein